MKKKWPICFFHFKNSLLFESLCFQRPLTYYGKILKTQQKMSKKILEPNKMLSQVFCHARYIERKLSHCFHLKIAFFSKFVYQPLMSYRKYFIMCTINVSIPCGHLQGCSLSFVLLNQKRKPRPIHFIYLDTSLFYQKFVFSTMSVVSQKWSHNFHGVSQNTIWTLTNHSLRFVTLDNRREKGPKTFVTLEDKLFWKCLFPTTPYVL